MAETEKQKAAFDETQAKKGKGHNMGALARKLGARLYALVIACVVVWTGYTAVAYLVRSVVRPQRIPARISGWAPPLTIDSLRAERAAESLPRSPFPHYHGVGRILLGAPEAGCSTSGCHGPLPHTKRKEIRAFANLHTTFLSCRMCHDAKISGPVQAMWISRSDGQRTDPPAILRLINLLESQAEKIKQQPADYHDEILALLTEAVHVSDENPALERLRLQLDTSEPGSPVWRQTIERLLAGLPNHARGEYHAELTLAATPRETADFDQQLATLAGEYLAAPPDSESRKQLHRQIHQSVVSKPEGCLACHGGDPPRLDFTAVGYSSSRAKVPAHGPIAQLMDQIRQGRPFHLPNMLEGK